MPRKIGDKNRDHAEQRELLVEKLRERLARGGDQPSFRELARAAGVSMPTLRHYFDDRDGVIRAVLEKIGRSGAHYLERLSEADLPFQQSIPALTQFVAFGFMSGSLVPVHAIGILEGLAHPEIGPVYLTQILEPTLTAAEARLTKHIARREMNDIDVRIAAIALIAPLVLAGLHQTALGGRQVREADLDKLARDTAAAFVRAHRKEPLPHATPEAKARNAR